MINISEIAAKKIVQLGKGEGQVNKFTIRVAVEAGGCSGLVYKLTFDNQRNDNDELIVDKDVKILVDKKSVLYLVGTTLEYSEGLNGKGFQFVNPNASRTCGCGESFSL